MLKDAFEKYHKQKTDKIEINKDLKHRLASKMSLDSHQKEKTFFLFAKSTSLAFGVGTIAILLFAVVATRIDSPIKKLIPDDPKMVVVYGEKIDDWEFFPEVVEDRFGIGGGGMQLFGGATAVSLSADELLGFSVGGAKDVESFRQNIEKGYLPLFDSLTYEGLFYEYFFDTGKTEECTELFCPSYTKAISNDPISGEKEYYLSVGLNSGIKESDFERKPLNLVVVLDISGSMGSAFDSYYYDSFGNYIEREVDGKTKMEVAKESLIDLIGHLNKEDRLGIVLFDDEARVAKPLRLMGETDVDALEKHIMDLYQMGGTNMAAGMKLGMELLQDAPSNSSYDSRVIFLTDAMPNTGVTNKDGLVGIAAKNAKKGLHATFIGIGIDFQSNLVNAIVKIEGANYYSVNSSKEFAERMDEGFEYMVTPLVFDLRLELDSEGYEIENVYGSPEADKATGEIMYVNTLFPSLSKDGETRGGLVLLKLKKTSDDGTLQLKASYRDRGGERHQSEFTITFDESEAFYDNTGIRKGIVLSRYTDLVKSWIAHERESISERRYITPFINDEIGIIAPWPILGEWEQTSEPLTVSGEYRLLFKVLDNYMRSEISALSDQEMKQELEILKVLVGSDELFNEDDSGLPKPTLFDDWLE